MNNSFIVNLAGTMFIDPIVMKELHYFTKNSEKALYITLKHDKNNAYDRNAIAVLWKPKNKKCPFIEARIGFIPKSINVPLLHLMKRGDYDRAAIYDVIRFKDDYNIKLEVFLKDLK